MHCIHSTFDRKMGVVCHDMPSYHDIKLYDIRHSLKYIVATLTQIFMPDGGLLSCQYYF